MAHVPAIVSQEQFDSVQAKVAQNQQFARRNNTAHAYLLRALVSCGTVSLALHGSRVAKRATRTTPVAAKAMDIVSRRDEKCPSRYHSREQLDELVVAGSSVKC